MDGQALFHKTLPATAGSPINITKYSKTNQLQKNTRKKNQLQKISNTKQMNRVWKYEAVECLGIYS